ncbi:NAD(P)H-dependent oxidoreductase [Actinocorallia sp. A-T 12471]|uniref:NADPH-dependent FMN reductase n=1 Tax=Actinocorallia sp. A-T 12471 TaxID=3089813 RepID=UPI0029CC9C34|nr:NAD(P)H-dependent oxidoreductase [Actinocorallia sp. A-T 12471]MDX6741194.1 NAD(P)H-dependent oxidoreductase [Actinocorallia sp. A-T 12471]
MSTPARPLLQVIIGSSRPGRIGSAFAEWFTGLAEKHGAFDVETIDLAEVGLPFLDEPNHPKLRQYTHQHTLDWSATVERADAYVLVTPEYNYGYSAVLKNALDFLCHEWADKPVGFVSYGGVGAGVRAVQQLKQVVTTLRMVPVLESVNIPFAWGKLAEGRVAPEDAALDQSAELMLDELARLTRKLRTA